MKGSEAFLELDLHELKIVLKYKTNLRSLLAFHRRPIELEQLLLRAWRTAVETLRCNAIPQNLEIAVEQLVGHATPTPSDQKVSKA